MYRYVNVYAYTNLIHSCVILAHDALLDALLGVRLLGDVRLLGVRLLGVRLLCVRLPCVRLLCVRLLGVRAPPSNPPETLDCAS